MEKSNISFEYLRSLLEEGRRQEFREAIPLVDPADLADFVEDLKPEMRDAVFELVDPQVASDVIAEIDAPYLDGIVEDLPAHEIAQLAGRMAPDEAADLILELDSDQGQEVLGLLHPQDKKDIQELLSYAEDTAGGLMTTEVITCPGTARVGEVLKSIAEADLSDPMFYAYIVDPADRTLKGYVSLQELAVADPDQVIGDLAHTDYVFSVTDEDQQEVARKFRRYDLWVMPVVDSSHRLVGRITVDDVIDVLHEEADEDLARMVGAPDIEEEEESLLHITRLRLPWLLITMTAGLLNSMVIRAMMKTTRIEALAIFVPAILAMGGNTGMQSSAICIRGIALDDRKYKRLLSIVWREIRVGIGLGLICGFATAVLVFVVLSHTLPSDTSLPPARLALAVGLAMTNAMAFASIFGAVVPITLHRLRVDPAVASGPFITTSNDLSATLIYFLTCMCILGMT